MGDKGVGKASRQRTGSLGNIRDFCSPRASQKRGIEQRSPDNILENRSKKKLTEEIGKERSEMTLDEGGYTSEGLASIVEELQKLERKFNTKFEEEKKERGEADFWFKKLVERMKKDNELREREWTARWGEKEKEDKKRDEKQVELEERLKRIETLIEEKGEGVHMEVESNERAKEREICKEKEITELKRRIEEGERRDKRKNIIVSGLKLDEKDLKENLRVWIDENLNIEVTITKAWKVKGREGKEIIGANVRMRP
ncbi:hypothetical protein QAD02_021713 [Eretmocerus hayati]|uniref:Uncharacterized protein n=1 Tax=Eretmocerus hayati TaxID=131215 RepID=A0ACC2PVU5_9HYME|nr:hypothetical protein QAD02_021713 [Eretmocerus hayati]